jgi:hypothetical protein
MRVCATQMLANSPLDEHERFLGLSRFGFSGFGANLYGRQLVFLGFNTGLCLLERSARMLQLALSRDDEFMLCPLGSLRSHFGKPQSFQGARAKRLGAGFALTGVLLHTAEGIGRLIYQIESCRSSVWCQWRAKVFIPSNRRSGITLRHVVQTRREHTRAR